MSVVTARTSQVEDIPQSMEDILNDSYLRKLLMEFLKRYFAEECLEFYEKVEDFERASTKEQRQKLGTYIVNTFVREKSPSWVNFSASTRTDITKVVDFVPSTFYKAKLEIIYLMSCNFLCKFQKFIQGAEDLSVCDEEPEVVLPKLSEVSEGSIFGIPMLKRQVPKKMSKRASRLASSGSFPRFVQSVRSTSAGKKVTAVEVHNESSGSLSRFFTAQRLSSSVDQSRSLNPLLKQTSNRAPRASRSSKNSSSFKFGQLFRSSRISSRKKNKDQDEEDKQNQV